MTLALFIEQFFNGVQYGLMLFLMAVGVTLVFGIMRVINLAHGSLFMIGGYLLMQSLAWTSSYALAVPLAFIASALVAIVLEVIVLRPLYRRGPLDQVLATFGLTLFFNEAVTVIWGREPIPLMIPPLLSGAVEIIPGAVYPVYRLVITGVAIVAGMLLYLLITRTRIGALIRAGSDNREIVAALGINISLLYTLVFALSAMLAALAGIMMGPLLSVEPGIGRPDPDHDAGGGGDRRHRLGARGAGRRADGRPFRYAVSRVLIPLAVHDQRHLGPGQYSDLRSDGGGAALQPHRVVRGASGLTWRLRRRTDAADPAAGLRHRAAAVARHLLRALRHADRDLRHGGASASICCWATPA